MNCQRHEAIAEERKRAQTIVAKFEDYKLQVAKKLDTAVRNATSQKDEEIDRLKRRISWQSYIIGCLGFLLLKTSDIFRKAVNGVIHLAKDYWQQRFDAEQVAEVKNALNLFGDDKQSRQAAGDFLCLTAKQKGNFDSREQIKAQREIDNVVRDNYEHTIKRGVSVR